MKNIIDDIFATNNSSSHVAIYKPKSKTNNILTY